MMEENEDDADKRGSPLSSAEQLMLFNAYKDGFKEATKLIAGLDERIWEVLASDPARFAPIWGQVLEPTKTEVLALRDKFQAEIDSITALYEKRVEGDNE